MLFFVGLLLVARVNVNDMIVFYQLAREFFLPGVTGSVLFLKISIKTKHSLKNQKCVYYVIFRIPRSLKYSIDQSARNLSMR